MWLSCLAVLPAGACWVMTLSLFNVTVQLSTPRWVVGRALALYQTATFGGMAAGSWIWGVSAEAYGVDGALVGRSEEHTSELQSLMRISYAVFCLKKKKQRERKYISRYKIKQYNRE